MPKLCNYTIASATPLLRLKSDGSLHVTHEAVPVRMRGPPHQLLLRLAELDLRLLSLLLSLGLVGVGRRVVGLERPRRLRLPSGLAGGLGGLLGGLAEGEVGHFCGGSAAETQSVHRWWECVIGLGEVFHVMTVELEDEISGFVCSFSRLWFSWLMSSEFVVWIDATGPQVSFIHICPRPNCTISDQLQLPDSLPVVVTATPSRLPRRTG
jgi:hypothetical protein